VASEGPRWKFSESNKVEGLKSQAQKLRTDLFGLQKLFGNWLCCFHRRVKSESEEEMRRERKLAYGIMRVKFQSK